MKKTLALPFPSHRNILCALTAILAVALLPSCAPFSGVKERNPNFASLASALGEKNSTWTERFQKLQNRPSADPKQTLGEWLSCASECSQKLQETPDDPILRNAYNFAVARVMDLLQKNKLEPWKEPVLIATPQGEILLSWKKDPRATWNPNLYRFLPADSFDVHGTYVSKRSVKPGLGAPLVAIGKEPNQHFRKDFGLPRTYYGVTAILNFTGKKAQLALLDPLATENIKLGKTHFPLAADFTVPLAVLLDSTQPEKMNIPRLLQPEKFAETAAISRLQPYDPKKTVVLVIHGLMDSPSTWTPMINELRMDPVIRKNFQFWFFSYPSGYPYPYSAALLRKEMDAALSRFHVKKPIIVIGHSMGGCITRLLLTDPGERIWRDIFRRSPQETPLSQKNRALLEESLLFSSRPEIGRAFFLASPLQGAEMAKSPLGRIGSMVVHTPRFLQGAGQEALKLISFQSNDLKLQRTPNSIDTLAPNNRFVRSVSQIPLRKNTPYHVIAGDRGKGGNRDHTKPQMSDGIVPFWSAYLPGAQSEKIIPSTHTIQQHPEGIQEVAKILNEHAKSSQPPGKNQ